MGPNADKATCDSSVMPLLPVYDMREFDLN